MRFGTIGVTRPESFPQPFNVYEINTKTSERGRIQEASRTPAPITQLHCILSIAKPDEQVRFHQLSTTVTHRILQRGRPQAKKGNIFALVQDGEEIRFFRVQAVHDKGGVGIHTLYYCEERSDRT